jgi:hypothetical protein
MYIRTCHVLITEDFTFVPDCISRAEAIKSVTKRFAFSSTLGSSDELIANSNKVRI